MIGALALTLIAATAAPPRALKVGNDFYLPGPPISLCRFLSNEVFSRDGKFLTYVDERYEPSHVRARDDISRGEMTSGKAVMRVEIATGNKQVVYLAKEGETLMDLQPIGSSGDIALTIALESRPSDQILWRAVFCPLGSQPRVVADQVVARSFRFVGSKTERKAFLLVISPESPAKVLFITPDQTSEKSLSVTAFQGGLSGTAVQGNPVIGLQGPPPDYKFVGFAELNFRTGEPVFYTTLPGEIEDNSNEVLVEYDNVPRSQADAATGQLPLRDLLAITPQTRLLIAQGILSVISSSPNGLAVVYLRDDGYTLREMVKADRKLAEKLAKGE